MAGRAENNNNNNYNNNNIRQIYSEGERVNGGGGASSHGRGQWLEGQRRSRSPGVASSPFLATDNTQMCSSNIYLNSVLHFVKG